MEPYFLVDVADSNAGSASDSCQADASWSFYLGHSGGMGPGGEMKALSVDRKKRKKSGEKKMQSPRGSLIN